MIKGVRDDLLKELEDVEDKLRNDKDVMNSEFVHPLKAINNWTENDWSRRLAESIRKTFNLSEIFGTGLPMNNFDGLLKMLNALFESYMYRLFYAEGFQTS